ncbi:MAG TPA: hypothetical protein VGB62_02575 [Allosphingosinicella sp.]|jgi:hypothetical protein
MDLSFFRRAEDGFAGQPPASLDFDMLTALLRAQQALSPAARVQGQFQVAPAMEDPITEILLSGPCWRCAAAAQRGAFSPHVARQGAVN